MLRNDFFTITSLISTDETISAVVAIDPDHKIFKGHFPGSPVTPGVVQLQIVKEILEYHLNRELRMTEMRVCKFLQIINPLETPSLQIDIKFVGEEFLHVTASGSNPGNVYFRAQVAYLLL